MTQNQNYNPPVRSALLGVYDPLEYNGYRVGTPTNNTPKTVSGTSTVGESAKGWFDMNDNGVTKFGNVLGNIGTGVGIASGLAGMYYGRKQHKLAKQEAALKKDAYNRQVTRDNEAEKRMQRFAANAGNGAIYK